MPQMRILLTGADTLIGSHILHLLAPDNSLSVRVTVESREKAGSIQQQYRHGSLSTLDFTVVPEKDSARAGTFNNVLSDTTAPFHTVIHTLSAHVSEEVDCLARFINLESESIISFLKSIQRLAKQVRRVVIVGSLTPFARWQQVEGSSGGGFGGHSRPNAVDPEYIIAASQAGNNIVYEAVSKWVRDSGVGFDVVYITAPSCYGPAVLPLETSSDLFEGNRRVWNICGNEQRQRIGAPPYGITHFLDVRVCLLRSRLSCYVRSNSLHRTLRSPLFRQCSYQMLATNDS